MTFDRAKLEAEIVRDEGERLRVYRCTAGKRTIGVGRNLDDVGIRAAERASLGITVDSCCKVGITKAESRALLANDLANCEAQLDRNMAWWRDLSDARQRVLMNMCFNMGVDGLMKFKNTLRMVRAGHYQSAAQGMLASLWARQVGARATRLAAMMRDG